MVRTQKIKRKRSLKYDFFLIMVFLAILPMVIYLYLDIFTTREKYKREVVHVLISTSAHVTEELNRLFTERYNNLNILARSPILISSKYSSEEKIAEMQKVQDFHGYFDDITYINSSGNVVGSTTYSFDSDISKTRWFKDAMNGKSVISPPYLISNGNRLVTAFFQPVFENEKVIGVLMARMDVDKLWRITNTETLRWGEYGYIIVLDKFNRIVSHRDKAMMYETLEGVDVNEALKKKGYRLTIEFVDNLGINYVGGMTVLDEIPGTISSPYFVLAVQARNEAFALSNYMIIRDFLQLIAAISFIILLSLYFSNRLSRPIEQIIVGTKSISEGRFGDTIKTDSWEELNSIAEAFNRMSLALKDNSEKLIQSEEKYRLLVETSKDGIAVIQDAKLIFHNGIFEELLGYSEKELTDKPFINFIHPDDLEMVADKNIRRLKGEEVENSYEFRGLTKVGEIIYVDMNVALTEWRGKQASLCFLKDISEQKRAEEALRKSEEQYRLVVEYANDAIIIVQEGKIKYINESGPPIIGYSKEEILNLSIAEFIHSDDRQYIMELYLKILRGEDIADSTVFRIVGKDKEIRWADGYSVLITLEGKPAALSFLSDITERKYAEEALKKSEKKYRSLVEDIDDGYFLLENRKIVYYNDAAANITGYGIDEALGKDILDFFSDETKPLIDKKYRTVIDKKEELYRIEVPFIKKDGGKIYMELRPKLISSEDDHIIAIAGIMVDISARKKREEIEKEYQSTLEREVRDKTKELFESEEKYRTLFETSKDAIYIATVKGELIDINPAAEEFFGYTREELLVLDTRELYENPEERVRFQKDIAREGFVRNYELTLKKKDGTLLECIETATVERNDQGNITGYHGTIKDITERKRLETLIINSRNQMRAAFDAVSERMFVVDDEYRLKFANRAIYKELNLEFGGVINTKCYDIINNKYEPCTGCPLKMSIEDNEGRSTEVFIDSEGENRYFSVSVYPIKLQENTYDYLVYSRDVTEEKRMTEKLIQQDRHASLGQLSAGVAHEINNPLTAILGYTQLLLRDIGKERKEQKDLKVIEEQALNCKTILDDLLIFSRTKVDKKEFFVLKDVLDNVVLLIKNELKEKNTKLVKKFKNNVPTFYGDQVKITQVFLNILQNSVYAVENGGEIIIETSWDEDNNSTMITFTDDGPGISEEDKKRIFDPFFTTKPLGHGTGLGLSVSYGIVREHGGAIVVESSPEKGAKFIVVFPVEGETSN